MSDLDLLRQRVESAEEKLGLIADKSANYSKRLVDLVEVTESRIQETSEKDTRISELEESLEEATNALTLREEESQELRKMLPNLLEAIENGHITDTLVEMDKHFSNISPGSDTLNPDTENEDDTDDSVEAKDETNSGEADSEGNNSPPTPDPENTAAESGDIDSNEIENIMQRISKAAMALDEENPEQSQQDA